MAANDAHRMTWCCIHKLCIHGGEGQYSTTHSSSSREVSFTTGRTWGHTTVGSDMDPTQTEPKTCMGQQVIWRAGVPG
jgi:hypothetical protein